MCPVLQWLSPLSCLLAMQHRATVPGRFPSHFNLERMCLVVCRWSKEVVSGVHVGRSLQELLLLTRLWDSEGSTRQPGQHDHDEVNRHECGEAE